MLIYKITNKLNGKSYIGQTKRTLEERIRNHKAYINQLDCTYKLYEAIRKYGWENFEVSVVCYCSSQEELDQKEIEYISYYDTINNGYNMGAGGRINVMSSPEVKLKHDLKMRTEEVRQKISESMKILRAETGFSEETRKKISESLKGNKNFFGHKRKPESILKTAEGTKKHISCQDVLGNIHTFKGVKIAAQWLLDNNITKCTTVKTACGEIKKSATENRYINGLLWKYHNKSCVEAMETVQKGVQ